MNLIEVALEYDRNNKPLKAALTYEEIVQLNESNLEIFLNLAVIYFLMMDYGFAEYHKISDEYLEKAEENFYKILKLAEKKFGRKSEIEFWKYYYKYIVIGEDISTKVFEDIAKSGDSLIPFFHLFVLEKGSRYRKEATQLYEKIKLGRTARERYIKSVLETFI